MRIETFPSAGECCKRLWTAGRRKAIVFPVPVLACTRLPSSQIVSAHPQLPRLVLVTYQSPLNEGNSPRTFFCTGVIYSNPIASKPASKDGCNFPCILLNDCALAAFRELVVKRAGGLDILPNETQANYRQYTRNVMTVSE